MVDRVLSRPLFRGRSGMEMEARDSRRIIPSPILGDTSATPRPGIESALMATDPYLLETFAPLPPSNRPRSARELAAEEAGSTIRSGLGTFADRTAGALSAVGSGLYGVSADMLSPAFATLGATTLAGQMERASDIAYNVARSNLANGLSATEGMSAADFDMEPAQFDFVIARAEADARRAEEIRSELPTPAGPSGMEMEARGRVPPSSAMGRSGMEREARGSRPIAPLGVSGMEAEARGSRLAAPVPEAPAPGATAQGPSPMEADARARAPLIANPGEVAAGLNAPDPTVRERTAQDFMSEYMANAPKYEGADKYLMRAMIGFAIAAGESPNAMSNIANGLLAGSQAMMKDKAEKAAFDRQIQLNAMQYGLTEVSKARERGRQPLQFVAMEDTVYNGKPVKAGTAVYIPYGEIEKNGGVVPPGFGDNEMITAMVERQKDMDAALADLIEQGQVDDTHAASERDKFRDAFQVATSAQRGLDYLEVAMLEIGDERDITGWQGSWDSILNKFANLGGLKRDDEFTSREDARTALQAALQPMIPAALSGTQTGNSISNFDVNLIIDAYLDEMMEGGVFSLAFVNEDRLLEKLKNAASTLESNRQQGLMYMQAIEDSLVNRTLKSGAPATSVIEPFRSQLPTLGTTQAPSAFGSLYYEGDGVYSIRQPGD